MIQEIEFAPDSPLEEAGFERSVPRKIADAAETRLFALAASLVPSERRLVCERDRRFESAFPPRAWGSSTFAASRMAAFLKAKLG
jgi:hypothetical protein